MSFNKGFISSAITLFNVIFENIDNDEDLQHLHEEVAEFKKWVHAEQNENHETIKNLFASFESGKYVNFIERNKANLYELNNEEYNAYFNAITHILTRIKSRINAKSFDLGTANPFWNFGLPGFKSGNGPWFGNSDLTGLPNLPDPSRRFFPFPGFSNPNLPEAPKQPSRDVKQALEESKANGNVHDIVKAEVEKAIQTQLATYSNLFNSFNTKSNEVNEMVTSMLSQFESLAKNITNPNKAPDA